MAVIETRATAPSDDRATTRPVPAAGFRPDIDGLRAVAIVLVVAYHAHVAGFQSGFVGVDIFFVISGFLIMTQIEKELRSTGSVRLGTFWARRARRLIPAAAVTVVFVMVASSFVYSAFHWQTIAGQGLAATFYVSNELYRNSPTGYFSPALDSSPLLNTWSLAVEEQFYLVWPSLLLLVTRLRPMGSARSRAVAVAVVVALSFGFSELAVESGETNTAYFSSMSRAWEFGVGALLALGVERFRRLEPSRTRALLVLGVVLLGWTMFTVSDATPFPGVGALLPVLVAAVIIVAGAGRDPLAARTLGWAPLQAVGRLSYSWYLWHWPVMVIGIAWLRDDSTGLRVALVLLALVPAFLTYRYLERALRLAPRLVGSNRRTAAVMLAFVCVVTVACAGLWLRGAAATSDPYLERLAAAQADVSDVKAECATNDIADLQASCVWGDPHGSTTVLVLGDSHAAHWLPALDEVGRRHGLRIIASMQGSCPSFGDGFLGARPTCARKIAGTDELVARLHPDLAIFANSAGYLGGLIDASGHLLPAEDQASAWQRGVEARAETLRRLGVPMLIMLDTPRNVEDPIDCLAKTRDVTSCRSSVAEQDALVGETHRRERAGSAAAAWGTLFDPLPILCPGGTCLLEDDGRYVYADQHHLTQTESRSLAPPVGSAVMAALGR